MRIGLLGTVAAWPRPDDDAAVQLGGVRLRGLLARLALDAGRPVPVHVLVDDLWGAASPDGVGNALQSLVSRLRRALGAHSVHTEPAGYRLAVEPDDVDALRFGELTAAARAAADPGVARTLLAQASTLWRGPALADVRDLPFATAAADRLQEQRVLAVEHAAQLALDAGDPSSTLDELSAVLAAQPLRERSAALLARALHADGRQADALGVLQRTRTQLVEQLGVDPGPELAAAQLDVLRGSPPPQRAIRPVAGLSSFVGRDQDVLGIRAELARSRLVTLTGPGGAGKTRLARESVAELGGQVRVAELAPLGEPDDLPGAVLAAVGTPDMLIRTQDEPEGDTTERLLAALAGRSLLLVLDNCEHLVDAVAKLTETILGAAPKLRVLATSREPLAIPGELLHPVGALPSADAVELFVERASAVRPGLELTAELAPTVAEICRRLDGQPLAIELAAARMRTLSAAEIASRLDDRFRLLTAGSRTALPRHQTLRAVVDWSWDLLSVPERVLLRRLAVFAGGGTLHAVEQVCGSPQLGDPLDAADVLDLLAALVDKSLVEAVPQAGEAPTRYRMLETIRAFAMEKLTAAGEHDAVAAAHLAHFTELAEEADPHLRRAEQLQWLAILRAEQDNLTAALRYSVATAATVHCVRLTAALVWYWAVRGLFDEAMRWVMSAQALPGTAPPEPTAVVTTFHALADMVAGHPDKALERIAEVARLREMVPPPRHPILELAEPVAVMFRDDDPTSIKALADRHRDGDPWVLAMALWLTWQAAENAGDVEAARPELRAAHAMFQQIGDRWGLGITLSALGQCDELVGDHAAAGAAYTEAAELSRELSNTDDLPQFLALGARVLARTGDFAGARRLLDEAADVVTPMGAGSLLLSRAGIERLAGDADAAKASIAAAREQLEAEPFGVPQRTALLAATEAAIELAAGNLDAAGEGLAAAVPAAVSSKDGPVTAMVAELAATIALAREEPERAAELFGVAVAQRGAVDRGNPEAMATLDAIRTALGPAAADQAVERGRAMPKPAGLDRLVDYARRR